MKNKKKFLLVIPLLFMTAACVFFNGVSPVQETPDVDLLKTWVAGTEQALTQNLPDTPLPGVESTSTLVPTDTPDATPTDTPTSTSTYTPSPTNTALAYDWAKFVKDVTVPDYSYFSPESTFTKIWRLENIGNTTWTTDYSLVFYSGERMDANSVVPLPRSVKPGEKIDLQVTMDAPYQSGTYTGYWMLRNAQKDVFGIGGGRDNPFWVKIRVIKKDPDYAQHMALNYCRADWSSQAGSLICPGIVGDDDGFVALLENPRLENHKENELTLWVHPSQGKNGWISGLYPDFVVKKNDHFLTWVGCLEGYNDCNLLFQLKYVDPNGKVKTLGEWHEIYDRKVTKIDMDLSSLAGQRINLILAVINRGDSTDAQGFWFVPRIENSVPTPTPVPSSTPTPSPTPTESPDLLEKPAVKKGLRLLADDLGTTPDEFNIISVGITDWPDTCLGLPEEGEFCEQIIVPGYWVVLDFQQEVYQIRTDKEGSIIRWEIGRLPY